MTEIGPEEPAGGGLTRREALSLAAVPLVVAAGVGVDELIGSDDDRRRRRRLTATPRCDDGPTDPQTEGPFFTPDSPRRRNLVVPGVEGTMLVLSGRVLSTSCRPIAGALLDFWQADGSGDYGNGGYRLRGHQWSDRRGRYRLTTIVPGLYPGRTRHIHVKLRRPRSRVLTTQLYFPGTARNEVDPLFDRDLLIAVRRTEGGRRGHFDFVLR
jgi:protocatechuate 3,4-dioxygenase beta subunit